MMDILDRRRLLITQTNPDVTTDYVVSIDSRIKQSGNNSIIIKICYVPDELILSKSSLPGYFESIAHDVFPSLEYAGTILLRDFSNELIPRWLLITLSQPFNVDGFSQLHEVLLQDHQPNWSNSQLLTSYGL